MTRKGKKAIRQAVMWAIYGHNSFYYGTWPTRKCAIDDFTSQLGRSWKWCRANGDVAVRVILVPASKQGRKGRP